MDRCYASEDPCRRNTDVGDSDPAACPPGHLNLSMTEPESWGSPSCFPRLPPQSWGFGFASWASANFYEPSETLRELLYVSWAKCLRARCGQGCLCVPRAEPPLEMKQNSRWLHEPAGQRTPFSWENAGRKNWRSALILFWGGPCIREGCGWGGVDSQTSFSDYLHEKRGSGTESASHFGMPHIIVFLIRFVLLTILDWIMLRLLCIPSAHASKLVDVWECVEFQREFPVEIPQ